MLSRRRHKRRDAERTPRLKGMTLTKMIPNMITVAATCAALTGVRYAIDGRWEFAVGAILVAAILDALDGRMARLLNAQSDFGAQLDSLSDFVAFGVAPALIAWFWALNALGGLGWVAGLFFAVCCGLRLARFNSRLDTLPPYAYNYFQGVPAPMGAALGLAPMILSFETGPIAILEPGFVAVWMIGAALLMVSEVPTFSFKKWKLAPRYMLPFMAAVGLVLAGLAGAPWLTLSIALAVYLALIPFSYRSFARLRAEAERLAEFEEPTSAPSAAGGAPGDAAGDAARDAARDSSAPDRDDRVRRLHPKS
ncbi:MAG: phosphatidylcholine/phosphatidylserine synthase [Alphaproteobacteria bacterium]|nr:phosphatidylcholine/phosphatidylserine synthase [Alphaproteobacteria bacterium]